MLTFYEGGFYSGVHEELIKIIRNKIASGKKCILIVPEQQTVMAESEAARILPPHAPLTFEVSNFTRFANTVLRALGGVRTDSVIEMQHDRLEAVFPAKPSHQHQKRDRIRPARHCQAHSAYR